MTDVNKYPVVCTGHAKWRKRGTEEHGNTKYIKAERQVTLLITGLKNGKLVLPQIKTFHPEDWAELRPDEK